VGSRRLVQRRLTTLGSPPCVQPLGWVCDGGLRAHQHVSSIIATHSRIRKRRADTRLSCTECDRALSGLAGERSHRWCPGPPCHSAFHSQNSRHVGSRHCQSMWTELHLRSSTIEPHLVQRVPGLGCAIYQSMRSDSEKCLLRSSGVMAFSRLRWSQAARS